MKFVTIFLVLSLVVLMAEPGECFFSRMVKTIKALYHGAKQGIKAMACLQQRAFDKSPKDFPKAGLFAPFAPTF
uniref:Uncharacterized protein n=1 Tax=Cyprinodon variegatus TaxID=28743 RepID=A0A3Q2DHL9_CYPVA